MKVLIDNRTGLSFYQIGNLLDTMCKKQDTQYYGKWKGYKVVINNKMYHIEILIMKRYFKALIMEDK